MEQSQPIQKEDQQKDNPALSIVIERNSHDHPSPHKGRA